MKQHIVLKLRRRHPDDDNIPDWVTFINDKSREKESINAAVDKVLHQFGVEYWLTNEFTPAGIDWGTQEIRNGLDRTYRVIVREPPELPVGLIAALKQIPIVEEVRGIDVGQAPMPSPAFALAKSAMGPGPAEMIYLPYAKALTRGSPDISIAVLDTGVDRDHPELAGRIGKEADFVALDGLDTTDFIGDVTGFDRDASDRWVGHGIHVSGILGARGLRMDEGVAPECRLMAVRVLAAMKNGDRVVGAGIIDNINVGIKWAVDNGADVINMSLGIRHTGGGLPHEDVIRYALGRNVSVVAASGNDGSPERYYPGALPGVIAVGAVDEMGKVAGFTSYGANIFVVAPGLNVYSASLNRGYAFASGTSQASPFVAGAIGLMKSYAAGEGKRLVNEDVRLVLKCTSDRVDSRLRNEHAGYGLLNLTDAFKLLTHLLH